MAFFLVISLTGRGAFAAANSAADEFDYPELNVTPLASERIRMEAEREDDGRWTRHVPIQLSALSTMALGLRVMSVDAGLIGRQSTIGLPAVVTGLGWIATTAYLSAAYRPYSVSAKEIKERYTGKSRRESLVRERMAEERLQAMARSGRMLNWLSFGTNLSATIVASMGVNSDAGRALAVSSGLLSLAPLVFKYGWQRVANQQEEYKKRIFGTFAFNGAGMGFVPDADRQGLSPVLNLSFAF